MKMSVAFDAAMSTALAGVKCRAPDVIGDLHSIYHHGAMLPREEIASRLAYVHESIDLMLRLTVAAERALVAPTLIIAEAAE